MSRVWDMITDGNGPLRASIAVACLATLMLATPMLLATVAGQAEGPPPYEPPAGYVPPDVDVRIVGLMQHQLVRVGSTHELRAEALDTTGNQWGDRFDWYVDGDHAAEGTDFSWKVTGPSGARRVTLVVSEGDDAAWGHVDVDAGVATEGPPSWLGPTMRALPFASVAVWFLLVRRRMARRRVPPDGSG
jgi:hypothetical protein